MNNNLVLNFLDQINKFNKKILDELKNQKLTEKTKKLIEEESSLVSTLETYIKESNSTDVIDKSSHSEELVVTMTELSKLVENIIKTEYKLDNFVKVYDDVIEITINSKNHDTALAAKIMSSVEKKYKNMYISVSFKE